MVEEKVLTRDKEMFQTPDQWRFKQDFGIGILPLRNDSRKNDEDLGYMKEGEPTVVYLGNVFEAILPDHPEHKAIRYADVDAVLAAGWVVD